MPEGAWAAEQLVRAGRQVFAVARPLADLAGRRPRFGLTVRNGAVDCRTTRLVGKVRCSAAIGCPASRLSNSSTATWPIA